MGLGGEDTPLLDDGRNQGTHAMGDEGENKAARSFNLGALFAVTVLEHKATPRTAAGLSRTRTGVPEWASTQGTHRKVLP